MVRLQIIIRIDFHLEMFRVMAQSFHMRILKSKQVYYKYSLERLSRYKSGRPYAALFC